MSVSEAKEISLGFCICGSFCTHARALELLRELTQSGYAVTPVISETAFTTDTRFGTAAYLAAQVAEICGREAIHTIVQAERLGPANSLDVMLIAPCTGNTQAKIAHGVTDTAATMAAKAHLRNNRPLVIALATNDGLSANLSNLGLLINRKNIYYVPFGQDEPSRKPASLVCDMDLTAQTLRLALRGEQLQPVLARQK